MSAYTSIEDQIRAAIDPSATDKQNVLAMGARSYEGQMFGSPSEFLAAAYQNMRSRNVRNEFRKAIGDLFAEYVLPQKRPPITEDSPAVALIRIVPKTSAFPQLYKMVNSINRAALRPDEVRHLVDAIFEVLETLQMPQLIRNMMRDLVASRKFRPEFALEAFRIELTYDKAGAADTIRTYAPFIQLLVSRVAEVGNEEDKQRLDEFFDMLKRFSSPRISASMVRTVFKEYGIPYGDWRALIARAALHA